MVDFSDNSIDIIIPDGNYMSNEIVYCLNNYFTNIGQGLQNLYVSFDTYTSHLIIRAKNSNDVNYEIIHYPYDPTSLYYSEDFYFELNFLCDNTLYNNNLHLNAGWLMGFNHPKYIIKKDNLYGANILNYAFLYIDDYNNNFYNTISSLTYESYIENNIIAKINITSSPNTILFNNNSDFILKNRDYFGPVTIEKLHIKLLDSFGKVIDIRNNNYSISLEFDILYNN